MANNHNHPNRIQEVKYCAEQLENIDKDHGKEEYLWFDEFLT